MVIAIFISAGAWSLLLGAVELWKVRRFLRVAVSGQGVVTGFEAVHSEDGTGYRPIVRFSSGNREVTFVEKWGGGRERSPLGSTVLIKFDPNQCENARIDNVANYYGGPAVAFVVGLGFLGTGLALVSGAFSGSPGGE